MLSNLIKKISSMAAALTVAFIGYMPSAWSMPIDLQLVVNVIQVCDDAGANCASLGPVGNNYFEAETDKIWAQAGIDIKFVFGGTLNSTTLLNGATGVDSFTGALPPTGTTMYLTNKLLCGACTLYGEAYVNAGGLAISMFDVMAFNGGIGRLDTIAHELGHNLGLDPAGTGWHSPDPYDLMASGGIRHIPTGLAQICPDSPCYDLLPSDQVAIARASKLLIAYQGVPEPGSLSLMAAALVAAGAARRRRA